MQAAKLLYRQLDGLFRGLDTKQPEREQVVRFLDEGFGVLRDGLRLRAGLLYSEQRDAFALSRVVGDPGGRVAETLDPAQAPLAEIFRHRVYIFGEPNAQESPARLGLFPRGASAGLVVGRRPRRHVLFFLLADEWVLEELDFALNTVRAALGGRLADARVRGSFREAAEIQASLLVEEPPDFPGYDIACRSVPAEEVGGDLYDFQVFDGELLGLAIGDASGHGLPAALLARDVVTGLRMGIEKELKVAHVFTKLNHVIHRSALSSRFVSVFYGELEAEGNLIYVNAGHQPPLLFFRDPSRGTGELELATGGTVIGPLPEPHFRRGFARMDKGEILVLCTDGILERRDDGGEFFGIERLKAVVRERQEETAEAILDAVFTDAERFGLGRTWDDDATLVVVKRLP